MKRIKEYLNQIFKNDASDFIQFEKIEWNCEEHSFEGFFEVLNETLWAFMPYGEPNNTLPLKRVYVEKDGKAILERVENCYTFHYPKKELLHVLSLIKTQLAVKTFNKKWKADLTFLFLSNRYLIRFFASDEEKGAFLAIGNSDGSEFSVIREDYFD